MREGRIEALWRETTRALGVRVTVSGAWDPRPGQYVRVGERRIPLVLASGPGEPLELLVGPDAQANLTLAVGQMIAIEGPIGPGFPLQTAVGHEVVVFAIGTGQAAARALLQAIARDRGSVGRVRAYLGAHADEDHAYRALDATWAASGIEVHRANSRPHVQDLFRAHDAPLPGARAFAAGHAAMLDGVRAAIAERGMDPAELGTNF